MSFWKRRRELTGGLWSVLEVPLLQLAQLPVRVLPEGCALALGRAAGRLACCLFRRNRRHALENLRAAFPDRPESWVRATAAESFAHFGQVAVEIIRGRRAVGKRGWGGIVAVPEDARVAALAHEGRGVIMLGGHLGNWELAAGWAPAHGLSLVSVMRGSRNPRLSGLMSAQRGAAGNVTIAAEGALRPLIRALRHGDVVALLADRVPRGAGVLAPFFGRDALTVTGPALLAVATGAPIVPFACLREGRGFRYTLHYGEAIRPDPARPRDEEVLRLTREFNAAFERFVRLAPGQWQWMHRRWKVTPGMLRRAGAAAGE